MNDHSVHYKSQSLRRLCDQYPEVGPNWSHLVLRDEKEDEDNMYTALVSIAAPRREDARHPKCGPSSGNSAQSVERHAEIVPCDKRA